MKECIRHIALSSTYLQLDFRTNYNQNTYLCTRIILQNVPYPRFYQDSFSRKLFYDKYKLLFPLRYTLEHYDI